MEGGRITHVLEAACQGRGQKYHKVYDGAALLKQIDPAQVRRRARHCDRLFTSVEALTEALLR